MNLEGIILNKNLVKSKDVICKILLRSGTVVDVIFYGGAGSKKRKSTVLEIGAMLSFEIDERKTGKVSNISIAKEYKLKWRSEHIRYNYEAFSLVCLFCEIISKVAIQFDGSFDESDEHTGLFNVLTNSFFHIDESVKNETFQKNLFFAMFLIKIFHYLGIYPDISSCRTCGTALESVRYLFRGDQGGFICENCLSIEDFKGAENIGAFDQNQSFKKNLKGYYETSFKEVFSLDAMTKESVESLINYLLFNFQIDRESLKSLPMVM